MAARSLGEASAASSASLVTLGIAIPVALLVLGVTTWLVVGRALRPVESMRREVDSVTAQSLSHRLPDPGGSDEIARLAHTLNGMLDRLDSSATAQRRFVGDASHELKTPLATIRQHAEVALRHPGSIDGVALAGTVLGEEARLTALVQGLLVLARADEGALGVTRRPVDLDDLVLAETARLRDAPPVAGRGPLGVDATAVGPARVDGDEGLLGQVVHNLVANAARHADSRVAVALAERDGRVELIVDDDGAGVAEADRERVFERFVRLDEARARDSGGSGLGLAIVREIVRVHGGAVSVTASPLGGARFVVTLPRGAA
ncbi:HAMP domain-containing protein [Frigoribacterium sp. VKM Ac-1396]|nr:HAMP domain-containing protein [Frigoribacterium sp. VKM Ac-1396]